MSKKEARHCAWRNSKDDGPDNSTAMIMVAVLYNQRDALTCAPLLDRSLRKKICRPRNGLIPRTGDDRVRVSEGCHAAVYSTGRTPMLHCRLRATSCLFLHVRITFHHPLSDSRKSGLWICESGPMSLRWRVLQGHTLLGITYPRRNMKQPGSGQATAANDAILNVVRWLCFCGAEPGSP